MGKAPVKGLFLLFANENASHLRQNYDIILAVVSRAARIFIDLDQDFQVFCCRHAT